MTKLRAGVRKNSWLITGATGFLGKVVLEELLRRREELGVDRVVLLIRGRKDMGARQRFDGQVATSRCFASLPLGWTQYVEVMQGDLSRERCGLDDLAWRRLREETSHIIHCAASVDFDLPVQEACAANIKSSLNMLELARAMPRLRSFVSTSTAYVTPHQQGSIDEVLAPLPRSAQALLADIEAGVPGAELLAETGHANTYTYTKCIAEHLLVANRGAVPLRIVRPSIISASHTYPEPGWIDSKAAFAGFVVTIGSGLLRVIDADPNVRLDIVPVDHVADVLIGAAMEPIASPADAPTPIVHAVAGLAHAAHVGATSAAIVRYFRRHKIARRPKLAHLGARSPLYAVQEFLHHRLPGAVAQASAWARKDAKGARQLGRIGKTLDTINRVFPYFTHHTFDFVTRRHLPASYQVDAYILAVCRGAYMHLMRRDTGQVLIGGRRHKPTQQDVAWSLKQPSGSAALRLGAVAARGAWRRLFDAVTFDEASFAQSIAAAPDGAQWVIVPTHRSYLDYALTAYLFFARQDLGLAQPRMAAAADFLNARPWLGRLWRNLRMEALPKRDVRAALGLLRPHKRPLQLFMEGQRSRGRHVLPLREDVLRAMRQTGRTYALLPVAISYERIAEETPFLRELNAGRGAPLKPAQLWHWLRRAYAGQVRLGRVHLQAAAPVELGPTSDLAAVSFSLARALRRSTVSTEHHLRAFLHRHPRLGLDLPTLRRAIEARGGKVLTSYLPAESAAHLDGLLETSMRQHWQHLFAADLIAHYPACLAVRHAVGEQAQSVPAKAQVGQDVPIDAPRLAGLMHALAEPLSADFVAVAQACAEQLTEENAPVPAAALLAQLRLGDRATGQLALDALAQAKLVQLHEANETIYVAGSGAPQRAWLAFAASCALPEAAAGTAHHAGSISPVKRQRR